MKAILFIMLFSATFAISILYARAAILSSSIVFIIFIIFLIFTLFKQKRQKKKHSQYWSDLTPYLLAILVNIAFTNSQKKGILEVN